MFWSLVKLYDILRTYCGYTHEVAGMKGCLPIDEMVVMVRQDKMTHGENGSMKRKKVNNCKLSLKLPFRHPEIWPAAALRVCMDLKNLGR